MRTKVEEGARALNKVSPMYRPFCKIPKFQWGKEQPYGKPIQHTKPPREKLRSLISRTFLASLPGSPGFYLLGLFASGCRVH